MAKYQARTWTDAEVDQVRRRYPNERAKDIAADLGRPLQHVYSLASRLGLSKSEAFKASDLSGRLNGTQGEAGRFAPGRKPWNHGKKGMTVGGRAKETQFKPGHKPHTWQPVGAERVTQDGYLERKVTDTGCTRRDYQAVHRLVWIEHHGEIPAGHVVVFKDALPKHENIIIDRLELITRAELASRNTIHRYPPDVKQVIRLQRKLERKVKELADEE